MRVARFDVGGFLRLEIRTSEINFGRLRIFASEDSVSDVFGNRRREIRLWGVYASRDAVS